VSCHGVDGNPDGSGAFPRLFGLPKNYLFKQLGDYASGRRSNDLMSSIAKSLTAQEAANVSAYYATAKEPLPKFPAADKGLVILGEKLATVGDQTKQVPACNNCHGPSGVGQSPVIPGLAGQFAPYIFQQLSDWQNGTRKNDGGAQMSTIVKRLSTQDLSAAAAYYQQVPGAPASPPASR
jgi:cytochrome c553